ncbi:MAG TPA: hypothetical protein VED84_01455 [Acidimicrobiales bacterium]|nr:hypothetical protein [Acidimicrobiales bacterium]HYB91751.1 hypothetical protein [Candidatus Binataceae bacterium]
MANVPPDLAQYPFYRARMQNDGRPAPWTLTDLEEFARTHPGDPFAGRALPGVKPKVALQIEATAEPPVWTALNPPEPDAWAKVLARMWARWGIARGETIGFFDYGSSPLVLLASGCYVAYLGRGASDRLGLSAICNDGVAAMAPRMAGIVEAVKPAAVVLRADLVAPFASALEASGRVLTGRVRWAAMAEVEGVPTRASAVRAAEALGVPVYRILRSDAAFLLAGECPSCRMFHLDRSYRAESLPAGEVAITAGFARSCPAVRYNIGAARIAGRGCAIEPSEERIEC